MFKNEKEIEEGSSCGGWKFIASGRKIERYKAALLVAIQLALMVVVFFQVNYLSYRKHQAWDLSQNQRFTLSDASKGFLGSVGGEVSLIMAFLGTSDLHADVKGLLSEYDRLGEEKVRAEYLDLSRSRARIAELKDQYQIQFAGDQILVVGKNKRIKVIRAEELVNRDSNTGRIVEFKGEEIITAALLEVTEQKQRKIYLITGGRRADELVPIAQQLQPLANAQNARLESLILEGRQRIPEDADALFFPGNTLDMTERELEVVRRYWEGEKGGLVFYLDASAKTSNLNAFLREHGAGPRGDRVLSVLSIPGMTARKTYDVAVALMPGSGPTRDLPALTTQLLGQTQSLDVLFEDDLLIAENIRPRPLMAAREGFWGETDFQTEEVSYNPDIDHGQPELVYTAASVEKGVAGDYDFKKGSSRLVVVGNPDLISPDGNTSKVGADFTMASLNWVMNREELIGITPRRPTAYTLSVSAEDQGLLQSLMIFLMPGLALIISGVVWVRRWA